MDAEAVGPCKSVQTLELETVSLGHRADEFHAGWENHDLRLRIGAKFQRSSGDQPSVRGLNAEAGAGNAGLNQEGGSRTQGGAETGKKLLKGRLSRAGRKFHILDKFTAVNPGELSGAFPKMPLIRSPVVTMG